MVMCMDTFVTELPQDYGNSQIMHTEDSIDLAGGARYITGLIISLYTRILKQLGSKVKEGG